MHGTGECSESIPSIIKCLLALDGYK